jgi:hypothetical protein
MDERALLKPSQQFPGCDRERSDETGHDRLVTGFR